MHRGAGRRAYACCWKGAVVMAHSYQQPLAWNRPGCWRRPVLAEPR